MPEREHSQPAPPQALPPVPAPGTATVPAGPIGPEQVLALQRTAGNLATVRMLARAPTAAPVAPDAAEDKPPVDHLMPTETSWQGLIEEGKRLIGPGDNVRGIVAVAGWAHACDASGKLLGRYRLKGTFRLPRGVYLMASDATYLVSKAGYADKHSPRISIPKEGLPEEMQKKEILDWSDWVDIRPDLVELIPSPTLVLVVDMPMASPGQQGAETNPYYDEGVPEAGYGSEVSGDHGGHAAPLPALSAEIVGLDRQPVGGTGDYRVRIHWEEVGLDPLAGASWAAKPIAYRWELWEIKGVTRGAWAEHEAEERTKMRGAGEKISKWSGHNRDTARRWGDLIDDAVQYQEDKEKAVKEGRVGDKTANDLNQALYGFEAIGKAGGQVVDTLGTLFTPENSDNREVAWSYPGMFVLRCTADIDPGAGKEGRPWRPPSLAAMLVQVEDLGRLAGDVALQGETDLAVKNAELALQHSIDAANGLEEGTESPKAAELAHELELMDLQARGEVHAMLKVLAAKARADYDAALGAKEFGSVLAKRRKEAERLEKLLAFAGERLDTLRGGPGGTRAVHRLEGTLVSRVTGEAYPLLLDVNEPQPDGGGRYSCTLADLTTEDGRTYDGIGASPVAAVWAAVETLADRAEYGEGHLSVLLPETFAGVSRADALRAHTVVSKPRNWRATRARLEELAAVLGTVATFAVPGLGVVGAIIGAGLAAEHLYDRWSNGTLRWDASLVTDVISVLGGVAAAGQKLGRLALVPLEDGRMAIVLGEEANRLGAAAAKFETWVTNPAGIAWANIQTIERFGEIHKAELEGGLSHNQATKQRAQAFTSALNNNLGLFVHPKAPAGHEGSAPPAGHEGPAPPAAHEGPAPPPAHHEPPPLAPLPGEALKQRTAGAGEIPHGQAGDLIRATGDWKQLKQLVDALPAEGGKRRAAEERLGRSRQENLDAELAAVARPPYEVHAFDSGSAGFRSDIDVTVQPREKRPGFKGEPRPVSEQIANAAEAADAVMAGLRRRFKGDPATVADIAIHAYIGEDMVKISSPEDHVKAVALEHEVGYAELRRGMSDEQWAALGKEMERQLSDGSPVAEQARADIEEMMRQGDEFKARLDAELRAQLDLVDQRSAEPPPAEERASLARDLLLAAKRRKLAELFGAPKPDLPAILRLQAEIRWFTPGAYATESAFTQAVQHGQARKGAGRASAAAAGREHPTREDVSADLAVSWAQERGVPIEERRARLAAAADANLGMFLSHAGEGGPLDQAKDAAKYGGRVLEMLDLAGLGDSGPVVDAFNELRGGKLAGAADPAGMLERYGKAVGVEGATHDELAKRFLDDATAWMTRASARLRVVERTAPGAPEVGKPAPAGGGDAQHVHVETPPPEADIDPDAVLDALLGEPPGPDDPGHDGGGGGGGGGGGTPPIRATGADPRAIAFQARFPKVDPSAPSMDALGDLFRRTSSGGRSVARRPGEYVPSLVRGAAPELKTIISFAARPDVVRIDLIPATTRQRTPDMVVHTRQPDGSIAPSRVEIRTITGGGVGYQPVGEGGRNVAAPDRIQAAVLSKVTSSPGRRSQLDVPLAGVPAGGTLVVHLPRGGPDAAHNVDIAMTALAANLRATPWVEAIEFFLPGTATVRYARNASGAYAPVP